MDIGTGLALLGGANLAGKILGPTADYIGDGVKTWAEKRVSNVKNIFSIAERKLGDKIETEGAVPPRVLKGILDEGSFCDDALAAEYFGGVLASSRSGTPRDDRGASFIALISRLSSYQIRTHYIFYHIVKKLFDGTDINPGIPEGREKMEVFIPFDVYVPAMEFDEQEQEKIAILLYHTMYGLQKENLIDAGFKYGTKEHIAKFFKKAIKRGILFQLFPPGIELFLWAYGKSNLTNTDFLNPANQFELDSRIVIPPGYRKTKE